MKPEQTDDGDAQPRDGAVRRLCFAAALLFFIGGLNGVLVSAAMTGTLDANPDFMLAAHLNALLGCFWLLGVAWTLPRIRLGDRAVTGLVVLTIVAAWSNWGVTLVKALLKVQGIAYLGDGANDVVHTALVATVVLPTLVASGLWAWGLRPSADHNP
ncbi:MAG: hypothetical protein VX938_02310 [Myxococcota bacterium]|nr:hypothetical protein [Myxococcota bacterium]MEE2779122.1 hypothetical protein [Myxococcota bacterium]